MPRTSKRSKVLVTVKASGKPGKRLVLEQQGKREIPKEERDAVKADLKQRKRRTFHERKVLALSEKLGICYEEADDRLKKAKKVKIPKKKFKWASSHKKTATLTYGQNAIRSIVSGGGGPGTGKKK